jgi:hypothetical protein
MLCTCCSNGKNNQSFEPEESQIEEIGKLKEYIYRNSGRNINNYKAILILDEKGCITCNARFSELLKNFINNKETFIIINSSGTRVDISPQSGGAER